MKGQQVFDPTALERAAVALREINQSPHAQRALELMMKQEEAKRAESLAMAKAKEVERIKQDGIEKRKNMEASVETNKQVADYRDKLERQRYKDSLKEQEESQQRIQNQNEESVRRQEEIRRETLNFQMKKQAENEEKKIHLQSKLQAKAYRENFDLYLKENEIKSTHERQTRKEVHQMYISTIRDGFNYLLNNHSAIFTVSQYILSMSLAYFISKYGLNLLFRRIEAKISQPKLVRETSRQSLQTFYRLPLQYFNKMMKTPQQRYNEIFGRVVLNKNLEQTLKVVSSGLISKKRNRAPLRNFLLQGPPGTGKTLFAKLLAHHSGLHYAIISGGDIEQLGENAVPEIDKLFNWCNATPNGTLIFIDEAESIFYKRSKQKYQLTTASSALSTFLAQTSAPSRKFSLILATNLAQKLDDAILDRMDQIIEFTLQDEAQRKQMLMKGLNQICKKSNIWDYLRNPFHKAIQIDLDLSEEFLDETVKNLEGFSARQIDKFILSLHDEVFAKAISEKKFEAKINEYQVNYVLTRAKKEKELRTLWSG